MDTQAKELNDTILEQNKAIYSMLSSKGKTIFFPKAGILSQGAQAQGKKINATIGIALEDDSTPMVLKAVSQNILLDKKDVFPYSPSFGKKELREKWKEMIYSKNPSLKNILISNPVATNALTHGLSMVGYLFIDKGDTMIMPDYYWENYDLVFKNAYGAEFTFFKTFDGIGFNVSGLKEKLSKTKGKTILLLNFPNNPTGYSLTVREAQELKNMVLEHAEKNPTIVICDDAYFGFVYKEEVYEESVFSMFADAHKNILAIKVDGPTKEDYVWGFRVGFLTYGIKGGTKELYSALENKTGGAIRGNISMAPHLSQSIILKAMNDPDYDDEKSEKFKILKERFLEVEKVLDDHPEYGEEFNALPYNSGYFMCVEIIKKNAENVRQTLLEKYDTGLISNGNLLRIAFSAVNKKQIPQLFKNIYDACKEC